MKLSVKNIGMIKDAQVDFKGLTVIAGENDTGKSTIAKLIFAFIKALATYEQDYGENRRQRIITQVEKIYFLIRRNFNLEVEDQLRDNFLPPGFLAKLQPFLDINYEEGLKSILEEKTKLIEDKLVDLVEEKREEFFTAYKFHLEELIQLITKKEESKTALQGALNRVLNSEFNFEINDKLRPEAEGVVSCYDGATRLFSFEIRDNSVENLEYLENPNFKDVTYIETPMILQMYDLINRSEMALDRVVGTSKGSRAGSVQIHTRDLLSKLMESRYFEDYYEVEALRSEEKIYSTIEALTGGYVSFKKKSQDFIFNKLLGEDQVEFRSSNMATGIKSFGIIQLLLKSGILNSQSLLAIDEPEVHLHPKWQVEYAKVIVGLVKHGIPILITSHSPYMIKAIDFYSKKEKIEDMVSYYFSDSKDKTYSNIQGVEGDLNQIFVKLAEPFEELVWKKP